MKRCKNPKIAEITNTCKDRAYSLSMVKLPEGLRKACIWCLEPLKGLQRRWCGDECVKEALTWGRPQSGYGLLFLLERQGFKCDICLLDWSDYMVQAVPPTSKYYKIPWDAAATDLLMKRFRRKIPTDIRPEVDHVVAISLGGTSLGTDNHRVLCMGCHKGKTKSDAKERFSKHGNPRKGVKFSEEHVKALSEARQGQDSEARIQSREENLYPKLRKPIVARNELTGREIDFPSSAVAALALGLQESNISRVLRGDQNRTQHKGWTFRYKDGIITNNEDDGQT